MSAMGTFLNHQDSDVGRSCPCWLCVGILCTKLVHRGVACGDYILSAGNPCLLPIWVEAVGYGVWTTLLRHKKGLLLGFFLCLFSIAVYVYFSNSFQSMTGPRGPASRANIMLIITIIMFIVATMHLSLVTIRFFKDINTPFPVQVMPVIKWDNVLYTSLFVTQELLGCSAAIYRCWILWDMDWRIVAFPILLFLGELGVGYIPVWIMSKADSPGAVMDPRLRGLMASFYSLAVTSNLLTTFLMCYRLWSTHRNSHIVAKSILVPIMWDIDES
ncbi:hypothetical protein MPER_09648, partial [Moniliophthora perniciosa FA553]